MTYKKRKSWDSNRPINFKIAIILALGMVLMAFNYTTEITPIDVHDVEFEDPNIMVTPPVTTHIKKRLIPPPKPKIVLNFEPKNEPEFKEEVVIEKEDLFKSKKSSNIEVYKGPIICDFAPKTAPIIKEKEEEEIRIIAERMPHYGDCTQLDSEESRKECTNKSMMEFIYKNVKYPTAARGLGVEGTVVASFVINKEGKVENVKLIRDIGAGCGIEVLKAMNKLDGFSPGKQNGRPVSVIYRIPVAFKLK